MNKKAAILVLEDGKYFNGYSFGKSGEVFGEVVFNTAMTGYQEVLTDPSYSNQIVTMTYPHIGNYGVNKKDNESDKIHVSGFIIKENSEIKSNWRSEGSLGEFLSEQNIVGIEGIDTRALVRHIRLKGAMRGVISTEQLDSKLLTKKVTEWPSLVGRDLVRDVTTKNFFKFNTQHPATETPYKVAVYDFGVKQNILECLAAVGCELKIFPADTDYKKIIDDNFHGVFLSNGPGDPAAVKYGIENVKNLIGKIPIFGICLGHQILSIALGASTYKLKFGHRGANQPVKNLENAKVEITSQNHGFAVKAGSGWLMADDDSFYKKQKIENIKNKSEIYITHLNLNDNTVEGISCPGLKAFSVQYHPESSPGPHDSRYLFNNFIELMERSKM